MPLYWIHIIRGIQKRLADLGKSGNMWIFKGIYHMTNDELLAAWYKAKAELEAFKQRIEPLVAQERQLRDLVATTIWPKPKEGTNNYDLPHGYKLKFVNGIDRKVDEPTLPSVLEEMQKQMFNTEGLIRHKPEVNIKVYRELSEAGRLLFDQCLIIKPKAPDIELVAPKVQ
jgi:hypothetical protein